MKKLCTILVCLLVMLLTLTACGVGAVDSDGNSPLLKKKEAKTVTVTLDPNGGKCDKLTLVGKAGETMSLPVPSREGYTFDQWYNDFTIVDNTVFPEENLTLTARYYVNKDSKQEIIYQSPLNEEYSNFDNWFFNEKDFLAEYQEKIKFLQRNYTEDVTIDINFDVRINPYPLAIAPCCAFTLRGANALYVTGVYTKTSFQKANISIQINGSELVNSYQGILRLTTDKPMCSVTVRNMNFKLTYIEKVGTIV